MKNFILDFKGFVNENNMFEDEIPNAQLPKDVEKLTNYMVNNLFIGPKVQNMDGDSITFIANDADFTYAPDTIALKDFGFELWSGKTFDVNLKLDNADETNKELTYSIQYEPKEARRAKVDREDDEEFVDDYEKPTEFDDESDMTNEPAEKDLADIDKSLFKIDDEDEDDEIGGVEDDLYEGRKKAQKGGFPKLKIKQAPKKKEPYGGFKEKDKKDILKKDPKKMDVCKPDPKNDVKTPPVKN